MGNYTLRPLTEFEWRCLFVLAIVAMAIIFTLCTSYGAEAASLKVCFTNIPADTEDVNLYIDGLKVGDLFPGQMQPDQSVCGTMPLPASVARGQAKVYTVKATNTIGEEGPASNAITFRYPTVPGAPTLLSVGAGVP